MDQARFLVEPLDVIENIAVYRPVILDRGVPELRVGYLVLAQEPHQEDVPVERERFGDRDLRLVRPGEVAVLLLRPGEDEGLACPPDAREPAVPCQVLVHRLEVRRLDPVDLDGEPLTVALAVEDVRLFPGADRAADRREQLLVDELVEGHEGDLVKDIVPYLHRIGVLEPDAHRLDLAIELFILFFAAHGRITCCRRSRVRGRGYR